MSQHIPPPSYLCLYVRIRSTRSMFLWSFLGTKTTWLGLGSNCWCLGLNHYLPSPGSHVWTSSRLQPQPLPAVSCFGNSVVLHLLMTSFDTDVDDFTVHPCVSIPDAKGPLVRQGSLSTPPGDAKGYFVHLDWMQGSMTNLMSFFCVFLALLFSHCFYGESTHVTQISPLLSTFTVLKNDFYFSRE